MPQQARSPQPPNQLLRRLLGEAHWTGARLASEINVVGAQQGRRLTYDRTTVAHWLNGTRPRPPVPELVAEVFTRALNRPISAADTGLVRNSAPVDPVTRTSVPPRGDAVEMLKNLNKPADRRSVTCGGIYTLAALTVPTWAAPASRRTPPRAGAIQKIGPEHIAVCRNLLPLFSQSDETFGAGGVREPLRRFLAVSVAGWLETSAEPRFRRELCATAAQLTYLCAFTHFDSNMHYQAQQYYLASLVLAHEAGDRESYVLGLRGLSVQAHALGHFRQADRLATQAVGLGLPYVQPHQQAFLLGQLALTKAALGDPKLSARHLSAAEERLGASSATRAAVGTYHPASLALHHAAVARALRDHGRAVRELRTSLRHRPDGENRSRVITLAHLAEVQLGLGQVDLACGTWSEFLARCPQISSARVDDQLHTLIASLRPHQRNRAAAALLDQALHLRLQKAKRGRGSARTS